MTWNTPTDVSTGNALTALLWNNQLGTNGSLAFLSARRVVLYKSTNTVFGGAASINIAFDTVVTTFADQQSSFPITTPVTNIPIPKQGMYVANFQWRFNTAVNMRTAFTYANGALSSSHQAQSTPVINTLQSDTVIFYAPDASGVLAVTLAAAGATTVSALAQGAGDSQILTIARIG